MASFIDEQPIFWVVTIILSPVAAGFWWWWSSETANRSVSVEHTQVVKGRDGSWTAQILLHNSATEGTTVHVRTQVFLNGELLRDVNFLSDPQNDVAIGADQKLTLTLGPSQGRPDRDQAIWQGTSVLEIELWVDYKNTRIEWRGRLNPKAKIVDVLKSNWIEGPASS